MIRTASIPAVLSLAAAVHGQVQIADHFDAAISAEWTSIKGNQWWADGWIHNQHTDPPFVNGRDSGIATHAGDMTWTNYTLSLRVDPILTQAFSGEFWRRADVAFRGRDFEWAYYSYGPHMSGYFLSIIAPGDAAGPSLRLSRVVDGVGADLGYIGDWTGGPDANLPYEVFIVADGPHIVVSIGGQVAFDVVDGSLSYGGVALLNVWETHARFDDVTVGHLPADPCAIDFNGDGFVDFFDYDAFVGAFEAGC